MVRLESYKTLSHKLILMQKTLAKDPAPLWIDSCHRKKYCLNLSVRPGRVIYYIISILFYFSYDKWQGEVCVNVCLNWIFLTTMTYKSYTFLVILTMLWSNLHDKTREKIFDKRHLWVDICRPLWDISV